MMKNVLTVCILVLIGVWFCDGQCWLKSPTPVLHGRPPQGCYRHGVFMHFDTQVTENCETCYCSEGGALRCCSIGMTAVDVPDDCKVIPAESGCGDRVVKVDNENEDCDHNYGMVSRRDLQ